MNHGTLGGYLPNVNPWTRSKMHGGDSGGGRELFYGFQRHPCGQGALLIPWNGGSDRAAEGGDLLAHRIECGTAIKDDINQHPVVHIGLDMNGGPYGFAEPLRFALSSLDAVLEFADQGAQTASQVGRYVVGRRRECIAWQKAKEA